MSLYYDINVQQHVWLKLRLPFLGDDGFKFVKADGNP